MKILFDHFGLIYKFESDGTKGYGDACAETMRYHHLLYVREKLGISNQGLPFNQPKDLESALRVITTEPGIYIRAPRNFLPKEWPDPVKDFSRDQHLPLIMALGREGFARHLHFCVEGLKKRNYFFQNGDFPSPELFNIIRRAEFRKPGVGLDVGFFVTAFARAGKIPFWDSGLKKIEFGNPDDVADDLNLVHCLLQAELRGHTWTSKKALKYYVKNRTPSLGTTKLGYKNKVLGAIAWYYRNDNPGLVDVYKPVVERVFSVHT